MAGFTPSPFKSGGIDREQGISKSGNPRLRKMMIQLAWDADPLSAGISDQPLVCRVRWDPALACCTEEEEAKKPAPHC